MVEGDDERFHRHGSELAAAVEAALPAWVRASVERTVPPGSLSADAAAKLDADIDAAGRAAATDIGGRLRDLLARDIGDQWTNPLSILRAAAVYPTRILAARGIAPVERDRHARRIHPDDVYDLTPGSFADFGPEVHELGITWGAAKAHLHLQQRRQA
ncbi:MAG: hypothetical protein OES24_19695 [Acidimicrobiia bacterium]|nr:hypothetical protein [Acidimicrobiia bacterium]